MDLKKAKVFFDLIKFEHTVFALPFAYLGMLLAHRSWPCFAVFFWITAAMVSARTAGMTLNRIIDLKIDAINPRTKNRPLVTGEFLASWAWIAVAVSVAVFFLSAALLNPLCLRLSPIALALLVGYHYVKRFSWLCHFTLGAVLAAAPLGGWLAVSGVFSWTPVYLSLAVLFWVAGFDILYSLQDREFDKENRVHSVPVSFGVEKALLISAGCHIGTVAALAVFGYAAGLGVVYWTGTAVTAALLWFEHRLIGDGELTRINTAFFTVNGWIGILLFVFTFLDTLR